MVRREKSKFDLRGRRRRKLIISGFSAFLVIFAISYIAGSEIMAAQRSHATELAAAVSNAGSGAISLTSLQRLSTNIAASTEGTSVVMQDSLKVTTNSATDYSVYLSVDNSNENGNRMYLGGTPTNSIDSLIEPVSGSWESPASLTRNTWGYAVPSVNSAFTGTYSKDANNNLLDSSSTFAAVPLRGNEQRIISHTTSNASEDTYNVYYGINANATLKAGTYESTIIYTAVTGNATPDIATVSPEEVRSLSGGDMISILTSISTNASNVGRAVVTVGDAICTNPVVSNTSDGTGPVVVTCYTPAKSTGTYDVRLTFPDYSNGKEYFIPNAIRYIAPETTVFGISYMQDMTPAICSSVPTPAAGVTETSTSLERIRGSVNTNTGKASLVAEAVLTDNRDNKQYIVRKMPDGNCWMSQNLDLDLTVKDNNGQFATAADGKTGQVYAKRLDGEFALLTKDNTDISGESWTISGDNIGYATQTSTGTKWNYFGSNNGTNYSTGNDSYEVRSYDQGDECRVNSGSSTEMAEDVVVSNNCTQSSTMHVGNLYNWSAATAGSGTYSVEANYTNVSDSICPRGWDLPTGSQSFSTGGQWGILLRTISAIAATGHMGYADMTSAIMWAMTSVPYSLARAGAYIVDGYIHAPGSYGGYWSSTAYNLSTAYFLYIASNRVYPGTNNISKGYGFSVRCVASSSYDYSLSYDLNGGEMIASGLENKTGATDNGATTIITIPKIELRKDGQVFLGWADTLEQAANYTVTHRLYDDSENHDGTGSNKITLTASNPNKTLYAVWADDMTAESSINKCRDEGSIESTAESVHDYIMADPRDRKLYVTRKLKDGQCWMGQNLDLDIAMSGNTMGTTSMLTNDFVKFTNGNTNLSDSEWIITDSNKGYATQTAVNGTKWNQYGSNNSDQSTGDDTYEVRSYDIDKGDSTRACYNPSSPYSYRACTTAVGAADVTRAGNYYNWPAATAGTGTYQTGSGVDVAGSICPAGWQLPYGNNGTGTNGGNTAKGFYYLLNSLGTSSDAPLLANPYSYVRAGYYNYGGYMSVQGSDGDYWSRMAASQGGAYLLYFYSSYVGPGTGNLSKGYGVSVRCVAQ